ncbi:MAG: EAL domain-containing protein [Sphingomonas sp.]|uniref:putative bifunctional diguanylate cyclase/phosphodiesterase n=1 Tax=Sphingomonas sp. TaxID=28214 RepID=UPI0012078317|nr:EAL domain-containing protein [Sphingomonas sp.]THD37027.1 MAG: EAL domain-containing protein [Sphingomonas sp.]
MALGFSRAKTAPVVAEAAADGQLQPSQLAGIAASIELIPVALALVGPVEDGIGIAAANGAFRAAGLGTTVGESPLIEQLGDRFARFLSSDRDREEFSWEFGSAVDCRHFRIMLARRSPKSSHCFVTLTDHTGELRTERNLRREMMTDSLTGLPNRAAFSERLEDKIAAGGDAARYAVLIIDLDRFSRVNACLGSMAGDELLITVARRLKGALRAVDVLARTGGDEFGILLTLEDDPTEADHVAQRIEAALATPFRMSDFEIRVACSIGVAFGSDEIEDPEDLIRHAQFAVKRSKASGHAEHYQTRAFDAARTAFGIETELRRAIEQGALRLTYQPICDLATGRVVSFESLARWTSEGGQEYSPNQFIPVAEESGLIVPLGRWALDEAAKTLRDWDVRAGGGCGIKFAVNLSAIQLHRDDIAPAVERALMANKLAGSRFTLELTESALVADPQRVSDTMHALKQLGATIAMDDFGTGYSNLAYLQKLPIDTLKIDRSFVTGMLADRDKVAIVRAILSLAQALGMDTTAEGIETNELAQTLAALGCTCGQGYIYAKPLEADAAYDFLMSANT